MKKILFFLFLAVLFIKPSNAHSQQYCEYVLNSFSDTLGTDVFYPQDDTARFNREINKIIRSYFKQLKKDTITYNVYLQANPKNPQLFDTIYFPVPVPKFIFAQRKLNFLKQEKMIKVQSLDYADFYIYFCKNWGWKTKY
jgi:3-hydroxy-3-methylglutaryl CoA synthase